MSFRMSFVGRTMLFSGLFLGASTQKSGARKPWDARRITGDSDVNTMQQRTAFTQLLNLLSPHNSGKISMDDAQKWFHEAHLLFATPNVTEANFVYGWEHLPSVIMEHKKLHFILHRGEEQYTKSKNDVEVNVFAGWAPEGGAYYNPDCDDDCTLHLNLRDIFTDAYEFLSNLLLLRQFFDNNPGRTIYRCFDNADLGVACRHGGVCSLSLSKIHGCKVSKSFVLGTDTPTYTLEFAGNADRSVVDTITKWWTPWAERLKEASVELSGCAADDLKVHFVHDPTEMMWLQTSAFVVESKYHAKYTDKYKGQLKGSYGGKYKEQDEMYARFNVARRANSSLNDALNDMNKGKHQYVPASGSWSTSCEIMSMERWKVGEVDPVISEDLLAQSKAGRKCAVLINSSPAFGSSAYSMGHALKSVFRETLQTFYTIGKAGGLRGSVGDYQIIDTLALWSSMYLGSSAGIDAGKGFPILKVDNWGIEPDASLWSGGGERTIHRGVDMNFPAVVLESATSLNDAGAQPWNAVGIEMEGAWFRAALADVPGLYMYYTSDLPMVPNSTLAHEDYPRQEGQTLYNGLNRMMFKHLLTLISRENPTSPAFLVV